MACDRLRVGHPSAPMEFVTPPLFSSLQADGRWIASQAASALREPKRECSARLTAAYEAEAVIIIHGAFKAPKVP